MSTTRPLVSVAVPLYNESAGIAAFHGELHAAIKQATDNSFEIIYCDDGSLDTTATIVRDICASDRHTKLLKLSRNFGKENALSAAIATAEGQAILMLDGDGQHPIAAIPAFIDAWKKGAQVVIGLRTDNDNEGMIKRAGSWLFYSLFNRATGQKLVPGTTDYRLIDRSVQQAFLSLPETGRITRGLIDWLGFERAFIPINRPARTTGTPSYGFRQLVGLATSSFVSLSSIPLYIFGYIGLFITSVAFLLGIAVGVEQIILGDPWHWRFTGSAMLGILILFLVGIILISQGIISLYLSHTHNQTKRRPLYIVDYRGSAGLQHEPEEV